MCSHTLVRPASLASLASLAFLVMAPAAFAQTAAPPHSSTPAFDSVRFGGLRWRSIGPYRGGRVTTVTGVPSQPLVYYMGAAGGGIWKTDDAGSNWRNVSDGQIRMGSIGALAVADDDPNVIYAGMGEAPPRGQSSSWGDGIYRSTDAGRSWTHLGLDATRSISRVVVHPHNSDVVYVAAQGSRWAPTPDRGIYRTTDGGKSWKLLLHVDDGVGASDLSMDPTNPRILYAAMWDFQRSPWQIRSGGPKGGIWKTTDGGDSWSKLAGGLPTGIVGKIGVSVAASNPDRVYAVVEADSGGMYRSDDAGRRWHRTSDDRAIRARAWYYTNVVADPKNADVVYVMNAPIMKSIDGGRTFQILPAKHGDNHALWINPRDDSYMINGNDGGAIVTLNGGKTWSTENNQPTAQIYRVNTDAQFPYWVYGAQQDNTTIATPSRSQDAGIDRTDWFPVGGCESAHVAFDPANPRYIYAGCYQGIITEFDRETRLTRNIMVNPALGLAEPSNEEKYRFNWSAPIATSPHDRRVIYHAGNVLFRSSDRGHSWTAISPDLTKNEKAHQGLGGAPITNEGAGGEVYNTIYYVVESAEEAGTIWVGTDDGLVQLTRDGGKTWSNVTPRGVGDALVNAIELSPRDRATAYVTIDRHKWNDNAPYIFKTTDYGKSWTKITSGLPEGETVRVVRAGLTRPGVLFAGTETGAFVSFDDGLRWQSLQSNLPHVPVTDLQIRPGYGDLVASTEGRAFWILDDLTPLRDGVDTTRATRLFPPRNAYRTAYGRSVDGQPVGTNPPPGAIIYYYLASAPDSAGVQVDIVSADGTTIRRYGSKKGVDTASSRPPGASDAKPISARVGLNRLSWDLRTESVAKLAGLFLASPTDGYRVAPGSYQVRLTTSGKSYSQPLTVLPDPRLQLTPADLRAEQQTIAELHARVNEIVRSVVELRDVRDQVTKLVDRTKAMPNASAIASVGKKLVERANVMEERLVQPHSRNGQDIINFRNGLADQFLFLADAVDGSDAPVTQGMQDRLATLEGAWQQTRSELRAILETDVASFNALLKGAPAVIVASPAAAVVP